ncbi:MAG: hypothetical protein FWB73_00060 [Treponema sp.]|nr:hypothetical protein [Treponema sp.]
MKKVQLDTIQNGAVLELFDEELNKVLANIEDQNTAPNQERSVTIKVSLKPDKTRKVGEIKIQVSSSLAKIKPTESFLFFDRDSETGKLAAYDDDPGPELPGLKDKDDAPNVRKFPAAAVNS